jgi:crossover junction endodeoxyribonuclease RuvC
MAWLSIDPGANGAIAVWHADGRLMDVYSIPQTVRRSGKKNHSLVDMDRLRFILSGYMVSEVWLERVGPSTGSSASFYFGLGVGRLEGIFGGRGIPINYVLPTTWQHAVGIGVASVDTSLALASKLYPDFAGHFIRKKDDGRAEAVLIGHYAQLTTK